MSIGSSFAAFGVVDGLLYLAARAIERLSAGRCRLIKYYLFAQPIAPAALAQCAAPSSVEVVKIAPDDPLIAEFPRVSQINLERFARGAICFAARAAGRFAGHVWIAKGRYVEDEVRCIYVLDPPGQVVWDFDVYVAPEHRLSGVFARLWQGVNEALAGEGFRWTCSRISAFNAASLAAHRRLGARRVHTALFLCLGSWQCALLTCAPYVHVSLAGAPTVTLRLAPRDGA